MDSADLASLVPADYSPKAISLLGKILQRSKSDETGSVFRSKGHFALHVFKRFSNVIVGMGELEGRDLEGSQVERQNYQSHDQEMALEGMNGVPVQDVLKAYAEREIDSLKKYSGGDLSPYFHILIDFTVYKRAESPAIIQNGELALR